MHEAFAVRIRRIHRAEDHYDAQIDVIEREGDLRVELPLRAWEKQVLSAGGCKRVGRHLEHARETVWGCVRRCVRRGPGGSSEPPEPPQCLLLPAPGPPGSAPRPRSGPTRPSGSRRCCWSSRRPRGRFGCTARRHSCPCAARPRVISDYHFRKTVTEYDRKPGIKWMSCTAK
jgi:hypothetical protein